MKAIPLPRAAYAALRRTVACAVYSSNVDAAPESIVLRHWQPIVGYLLPGGIVSHRSAFDGKPHEGALSITRGKTRRTLKLPGLTIHVLPGPGPRRDAPAMTRHMALSSFPAIHAVTWET